MSSVLLLCSKGNARNRADMIGYAPETIGKVLRMLGKDEFSPQFWGKITWRLSRVQAAVNLHWLL